MHNRRRHMFAYVYRLLYMVCHFKTGDVVSSFIVVAAYVYTDL
jgi:hypothetical protein